MMYMCFSLMLQGVGHRQTARWSVVNSQTSDAVIRRFPRLTATLSLSHQRGVCLIPQNEKSC
jgi:hypothetical protein